MILSAGSGLNRFHRFRRGDQLHPGVHCPIIQGICLILYLVPRTAVLGAVLWTGYLGGAIATHVRVGSPLFSHVLFPIYVAAFLWIGLWLRDWRVRAMLNNKEQGITQ